MLVTLLLVLAVALCLYTVVQVLSHGYVNMGGFMMFRVVTGSMEPTIPVGALLVTQQVDIESIAPRQGQELSLHPHPKSAPLQIRFCKGRSWPVYIPWQAL